MRNKLIVKRYVKEPLPGARTPSKTITERIRTMIKGKRYIVSDHIRKTDYVQACQCIASFSDVITATWYDRLGTPIDIIRKGKAMNKAVKVDKVWKVLMGRLK